MPDERKPKHTPDVGREQAAEPARIVVLCSGRGSNLQALIDASQRFPTNFRIAGVISDRVDAGAIQRAEQAGIGCSIVARSDYNERAGFEQALLGALAGYRPDWIILAGFMRVLSADAVQAMQQRAFNIHPSLLPKFPGLDTHRRAIAEGEHEHGASVHLVIPALDQGPVLAQVRIPILATDHAESLAQRLLSHEHELLCACVRLLASGRVEVHGRTLSVDGLPLEAPIDARRLTEML